MKHDLNTVKTTGQKPAYHHGDLRAALISAAEATIRERGVDGFSLREAARRAGVSPAAPQHHFGDARGLLTAVATAGFQGLGDALATSDAASAASPSEQDARLARIHSQGRAYVAYALAEPARFDVMWRKGRIDSTDAAYNAAAARAFELLCAAVEDRAPNDAHPGAQADARVIAAWSIVHGFARLALDGAFGTEPGAAEAAAEAMLPSVIERVRL